MSIRLEGPWIAEDGPDVDVVMSCRARVARNVRGFPFVNRASDVQRRAVVDLVRDVVTGAAPLSPVIWVDLQQATERDRRLLVERHLISRAHAEGDGVRAVAITNDESTSVMVNEEDHLRMQVLGSGLRLQEVHQRLDEIDDAVEARVDYAFDKRFGYLTACPTNLGTGIRFSAMLHLPGLKITNEIGKVRQAAKDLHLAVRGYFGEGSESAGDFYQVSNQVTLGRTEEEILAELAEGVLPRLVRYERHARRRLLEDSRIRLEDAVHRSLGVLRGARLIGTEEAMKHLSRLRLGIHCRLLEDVPASTVNRLFLQVQPAHLRFSRTEPIARDELKRERATLVRRALGGA